MQDQTIDTWLELQDRKRERRINGQRKTIKRLIRIYARYATTIEKKDKLQAIAAYCDKHAFIPESYMTWLEELSWRYCLDRPNQHKTKDDKGQYCPD